MWLSHGFPWPFHGTVNRDISFHLTDVMITRSHNKRIGSSRPTIHSRYLPANQAQKSFQRVQLVLEISSSAPWRLAYTINMTPNTSTTERHVTITTVAPTFDVCRLSVVRNYTNYIATKRHPCMKTHAML